MILGPPSNPGENVIRIVCMPCDRFVINVDHVMSLSHFGARQALKCLFWYSETPSMLINNGSKTMWDKVWITSVGKQGRYTRSITRPPLRRTPHILNPGHGKPSICFLSDEWSDCNHYWFKARAFTFLSLVIDFWGFCAIGKQKKARLGSGRWKTISMIW